MRYHWGLGVGHTYSHQQIRSLSTTVEESHIPNSRTGRENPGGDVSGSLEQMNVMIQGSGSPPQSEAENDGVSEDDEDWKADEDLGDEDQESEDREEEDWDEEG